LISIASDGHSVVQIIQAVHSSSLTGTAISPFISNTSEGHSVTQMPHPLHSSSFTITLGIFSPLICLHDVYIKLSFINYILPHIFPQLSHSSKKVCFIVLCTCACSQLHSGQILSQCTLNLVDPFSWLYILFTL